MKNLFLLLIFVSFSSFSQINVPNETVNLLLEGAKITGSVTDGRGLPADIVYNLEKGNYNTGDVSKYAEYGVNQGEKFDVFYWMATWETPIRVNYITLGGSYSNQSQDSTSWNITYIEDGVSKTLAEGVGGWLSNGVYEWKNEEGYITITQLRFEALNGVSTHLRGRGGSASGFGSDDSKNIQKSALVQLLPKDEIEEEEDIASVGSYEIYKDSIFVDKYQTQKNGLIIARKLKYDFPSSLVELRQPNYILDFQDERESRVVAKITEMKMPIKKIFILKTSKYSSDVVGGREIGNGCGNSRFFLTSIEPFDFKGMTITLNNAVWVAQSSLLNNGVEITELEALSKGLLKFKCENDTIITQK